MTPEQMAMFQTRDTQDPTGIPGQVQQACSMESEGLDVINEGLGRTMAYMAQNGPVRPVQRRTRANVMTKQQLEEQKMNESEGLPSNLEEAGRVVALEGQVAQINDNINKLAGVMTQLVQNQQPALPPTPPVKHVVVPPEVPPVGRHLTPPARHAADQFNELLEQNKTSAERNHQQSELLAPPTVRPTPEVQTPAFVPDSCPPETQPQVSLETPDQRARRLQDIADQDLADYLADKASRETAPPTPSMSMGPVGAVAPPVQEPPFQLVDDVEPEGETCIQEFDGPNTSNSPGEDQFELVEEEPSPVDPAETKRLERQQILFDQVANWLDQKDPHKFWRQFLAGACNKNLSYNTWPPEFKAAFDLRFRAMISDPQILATVCGRITKMQNGHLVAPHVAGAFMTVMAGFLSFALMEV